MEEEVIAAVVVVVEVMAGRRKNRHFLQPQVRRLRQLRRVVGRRRTFPVIRPQSGRTRPPAPPLRLPQSA